MRMLMRGVRGRDKTPGAFRTEQNWIGSTGCSLEDASFVPVPQAQLQSGVDAWAAYVGDNDQVRPRGATRDVHAEFEALHPFKDGNGRLGRMIIPLFLFGRKLLTSPSFYMSGYLDARRDEYIEALRSVSRDGAWTEWCEFFPQGLIEQAGENQAKAQAILKLHRRVLDVVAKATHSEHAHSAVEFLFARPIFCQLLHFVTASSQILRPTAWRISARSARTGEFLATLIEECRATRLLIFAFPELAPSILQRPDRLFWSVTGLATNLLDASVFARNETLWTG